MKFPIYQTSSCAAWHINQPEWPITRQSFLISQHWKTFSTAKIIIRVQRAGWVIAHSKGEALRLCGRPQKSVHPCAGWLRDRKRKFSHAAEWFIAIAIVHVPRGIPAALSRKRRREKKCWQLRCLYSGSSCYIPYKEGFEVKIKSSGRGGKAAWVYIWLRLSLALCALAGINFPTTERPLLKSSLGAAAAALVRPQSGAIIYFSFRGYNFLCARPAPFSA